MASWFPSGVAAPASPPPRRGCNPSRFGASPNSSRACGPRSPRARSPHSKSAGAMARGACVPWASSGARAQAGWWGAVLGALCLLPVLLLLVRLGALPAARPASSAAQAAPDASSEHLLPLKEDAAAPHPAGVLTTPGPGPLLPQAPRRRRYTLTPARLRWDHFNLTYRILSFPRNLLSPSETRRGLAAAFRMWSDVSPFSFREVAPEQPSDLRIGFYPANHTDCLVSALHHCFDGPTGELAHAFFPPHGGIHFDDSEYWVLGPTRYSWKKGVWLTDLVHVAAHEIGHALGLMHSQHGRALMHLNATLRGWKALSQDELWGLHRLYGCLDRLFVCASWARRGFCDARRRLMKRLCPSSCDFCYEFPFPTVAATAPPPRTKTRLVSEGRNVTFRCGQKILHKKGKVHWYKDQEPLESSYPGYLALGEAHLSIIANAINEGTYTCVVRRRQRVLTTYSWRVRVRP
ncbi:matrix metalloproteinase-23 isoform X1 [Myotis myotis]|uniref:matrix metalloproteinase-23 isoform X1 n=1 Tax=Myotis myotis TaxID=51298 RepID=UPI00174B4D92|nr:matrix metalloproteinase-23 isoform X1 [Myotis myotis]